MKNYVVEYVPSWDFGNIHFAKVTCDNITGVEDAVAKVHNDASNKIIAIYGEL